MTELPPYYKWRCKNCRGEKKHTVVTSRGKWIKVGDCDCKEAQEYELVPLSKRAHEARLK